MNQLTRALGNVTHSVVFILSKADLAEKNTLGLKKTAIKDCNKLGVKHVEWTDKADKQAMERQLLQLRTAISQVVPFNVSQLKELEDEIRQRAEFLRQQDDGGFLSYNFTVSMPNITEFEKSENVTLTEQVAKYNTTEALLAKAKELQKIGPKDPMLVSKAVTKRLQEQVPVETSGSILGLINWHNYDTITTSKDVLVNETEIHYVEKPIEFYVDLLRNEMELKQVNSTRVVKGVKVNSYEEQREVKVEKHPFEYYLDAARQQLMDEIWEALRLKAQEATEED